MMRLSPSLRVLLVLAAGLGAGACLRQEMPKDFVNEELFGKIAGKEWAYRHAYVDPTVETPEEDDLVFVFLPYAPKNPCPKPGDGGAKDQRSLTVAAPGDPKKQTKLKRGTSRTLVFHFDKNGEQFATVAKEGKLKILENDGKQVRGRLFAQYSPGNWVSGNFVAKICDYQAFKDWSDED
jgi:hypothetical protein